VINKGDDCHWLLNQASDVAHVQHWRLSQMERALVQETYKAYLEDAQRRILLQTGTKLKWLLTFTSFHWPEAQGFNGVWCIVMNTELHENRGE
jgi:hypothetical protein